MKQLLEIIKEKAPNIYQLDFDISQENLTILCQENNCKLFYLNGENINNKEEFFQESVIKLVF